MRRQRTNQQNKQYKRSNSINIHIYAQIILMLLEDPDVLPARLHAAGVVVLRVHTELEEVRVAPASVDMQLLLAVDVHGERRRLHIVDHVQSEPSVIDGVLDELPVVVPQCAIVDVQHERAGGLAGAKHLHDTYSRGAGGDVPVGLELPHAGAVVVPLQAEEDQ